MSGASWQAGALPPRSGGGEPAGLVPSKTTQGGVVSLGASAVAERRVKRLKRSVWASGHLHAMADAGRRPPVAWFVTLTYASASAWQPNHVRDALTRFRDWCRARRVPCRYTWVAEIQPRRFERTGDAVVHYHLLAWLPTGMQMPKWDTAGWWPHGMANRDVSRAGVGYLMKYLSKLGDQSRFPKGLRLYGIGGLDRDGRGVRAWFNLPQWAKRAFGVGDLERGARGLVVRATREVLPPVFRVRRVPGGLELRKLRDVACRFGLPPDAQVGAFSAYPRLA